MVIADTLAGGGGDSTLGNLTAPIDYDIGKHSKDLSVFNHTARIHLDSDSNYLCSYRPCPIWRSTPCPVPAL